MKSYFFSESMGFLTQCTLSLKLKSYTEVCICQSGWIKKYFSPCESEPGVPLTNCKACIWTSIKSVFIHIQHTNRVCVCEPEPHSELPWSSAQTIHY